MEGTWRTREGCELCVETGLCKSSGIIRNNKVKMMGEVEEKG